MGSNIHTFYCSTWIPTLWAAPLVSSSLAIFVFIPITRGWNASTTFFLAMIENSQRFISRRFYQLSWSKNVESPCRRKSTKVYTFWKGTKRKGKTKAFISQTINLRCVHVMCTVTASEKDCEPVSWGVPRREGGGGILSLCSSILRLPVSK